MSESIVGSARAYAALTFRRVLRVSIPWDAALIGVAVFLQLANIRYAGDILLGYGTTAVAIIACYRVISGAWPSAKSSAAAMTAYCVQALVVGAFTLLLVLLFRGPLRVFSLIQLGAVLWIGLKLQGVPFFVLFASESIPQAFASTWKYISGERWLEYFGNTLVAGIPCGIFIVILRLLHTDAIAYLVCRGIAQSVAATYVTAALAYIVTRRVDATR